MISLPAAIEQSFTNATNKRQSLTERLAAMDQYTKTTDPQALGNILDFSKRPEGYNPLTDLKSAMLFSENSRSNRAAAAQDVAGADAGVMSSIEAMQRYQDSQKKTADTLSQKDRIELELAAREKGLKLQQNADGTFGITEAKSGPSEDTKNIISVAEKLLKENTKPITGAVQFGGIIPGTKAQKSVALFNQLQSLLSLDNRQKLKGSGAISDFEARTLEKAASALSRNLSDDDFKAILKELSDTLNGGKKSDVTDDPLGILK